MHDLQHHLSLCDATIAIYDLTGKLVKVTEEAPVNIADLAKGCYIVKITMGNTDKAMKFMFCFVHFFG